MQGRKEFIPQLFYELSLDRLVPSDNFYRGVNQVLDLHFLYKSTQKYYGTQGQESIDPVVFFKILLVGYLNNINSDRALIRYCSNCLDVRLFLGYDLNEELPWHSTISRTRSLFGEEVFLQLFQLILKLCVNKAFLPFKRTLIDSKGYEKKSYRSSEKDCGQCPLRSQCCGKVTKFKKLEESIHKPLYDKMHEKLR